MLKTPHVSKTSIHRIIIKHRKVTAPARRIKSHSSPLQRTSKQQILDKVTSVSMRLRSLRLRRPVGTSLATPTKLTKIRTHWHQTCAGSRAFTCLWSAMAMALMDTKLAAISNRSYLKNLSRSSKSIKTFWTIRSQVRFQSVYQDTSAILSRRFMSNWWQTSHTIAILVDRPSVQSCLIALESTAPTLAIQGRSSTLRVRKEVLKLHRFRRITNHHCQKNECALKRLAGALTQS